MNKVNNECLHMGRVVFIIMQYCRQLVYNWSNSGEYIYSSNCVMIDHDSICFLTLTSVHMNKEWRAGRLSLLNLKHMKKEWIEGRSLLLQFKIIFTCIRWSFKKFIRQTLIQIWEMDGNNTFLKKSKWLFFVIIFQIFFFPFTFLVYAS